MGIPKFFTSFFLAGLCLLSPSCSKNIPASPDQKTLILVSIAPYQFLTQRIAGDEFAVLTVSPIGINPHAFEPTSKQIAALDQGTVWFRIGEPFEEKVLTVLKGRNPSLITADLREGIDLLDDHACSAHCCSMDHLDRHIWLSPRLASLQARHIAKVLADRFPGQREKFFENAKVLAGELDLLDQEIATLLGDAQGRVLLVSHPAFGYFCRDYHFEQLSVEFEGKDPRPRHLEAVVQKAIAQGADLALAMPQHNNKGTEIIAGRLHLPIRMVDPYSPKYFETMRLLAHVIADPEFQP